MDLLKAFHDLCRQAKYSLPCSATTRKHCCCRILAVPGQASVAAWRMYLPVTYPHSQRLGPVHLNKNDAILPYAWHPLLLQSMEDYNGEHKVAMSSLAVAQEPPDGVAAADDDLHRKKGQLCQRM